MRAVAPEPPPAEPPVYRPFALVAFGAAVLAGTPLGLWMLAWLYLGAPAVPAPWVALHAHMQVFGFFGTLIPGVAQHLLPRFAGGQVTRSHLGPWLAAALGAALLLRILGTALGPPAAVAGAAAVQAIAFTVFAAWVWRFLDPVPLRVVRAHLVAATLWLAAACLLETALRVHALAEGASVPGVGGLRAVHAIALLGGGVGWVLGVLLRAGPMFVACWHVAPPVARAVPAALALACALAATGEMGPWDAAAGAAVARAGDSLGLAAVVAVALAAGVFRRAPRSLPMLSRSPYEARIFRLAIASASAALVAMLIAFALAARGTPAPVATDAGRHLLTVGVLTSVVVAMAFRLIPVLERVALPWPRLRHVALAALAGAVVLRTLETLVPLGWTALAPLIVASGALVWVALAAVAANLAGAMVASGARRAG